MSPRAPQGSATGGPVLTIGLDVGGTSTRAVVATVTGEIVGTGRAGGGNPISRGTEAACAELLAAFRAATATVDTRQVGAVVIGLAGAVAMGKDPAVQAMLGDVCTQAGLSCTYQLVPDLVTAFAAGSTDPDGTVLVAGTGAVAGAIRGFTLQQIADGHGWLLGDAGSGFWLGREAVRHTLATLEHARKPSELAGLVLAELLGSSTISDDPRDTINAVIRNVHASAPVNLAALAPLVMRAQLVGDQAAGQLLADAADQLVHTISVARRHGEHSPVVLAGSLLTNDTPLAAAVRARLAANWSDAPLRTAGDAAAAAAWLAATGLDETIDRAALHARLLGPMNG